MPIRDSRRLTGPNLLSEHPGAVLDIGLGGSADALIEAWRAQARRILDAVGWRDEKAIARAVPGGVILAISAPIDALYAATEVNEWAFAAAESLVTTGRAPSLDEAAERLIPIIRDERNPRLLALRDEAVRRGVSFLSDDDLASIGLGKGSQTWPVAELPEPQNVDWSRVRDVPLALVTGTNGKTTTVRMLAAIADAAGQTPGSTSTDGIWVGDSMVERGDYSGPGGARKVLRDTRVEVAFLETARGGMLRRGLPVRRADAALVTNVAADHLGEFGVHDLRAIAETKLVVRLAFGDGRALVLNADDDLLRELGATLGVPVMWFSLTPRDAAVAATIKTGVGACVLDGDALVVQQAGRSEAVLRVEGLPIAHGGAARHNIANALAAIAVARSMGYETGTIAAGLGAFDGSAASNPGRANVWNLGGVRVIVDFAHNPHGLAAMIEMARALPAKRRLIAFGQAGDRDDASIRELARTAWGLEPDRVIIKGMKPFLRGRPAGEVPAIIEGELVSLGAGSDTLVHVDDENDATHEALTWARDGDSLLILVHGERAKITSQLDHLAATRWRPGDPID